ncbi:MAG: hypothetical protein ACXADY_11505 [Candidatus Hodarchaeales archaeon]|jgi:hypothetical protein
MSQAYLDVFTRFVKIQELMQADDKKFRREKKKCARIASMLVMASVYSKYSVDKQYAVYKAMIQTMKEKLKNFKDLGESVDDIAASLIFASEINKFFKK